MYSCQVLNARRRSCFRQPDPALASVHCRPRTTHCGTKASEARGSWPFQVLGYELKFAPACLPDRLWHTPRRHRSNDPDRRFPCRGARTQTPLASALDSSPPGLDRETHFADTCTDTSCTSASVCYRDRSNTLSHLRHGWIRCSSSQTSAL